MAVITIFLCADRFVPRARGSSLCRRGLLVGSRTGWSLLRQYWWAFFTNTFQVDGSVPSFVLQVGLQASATLLLISALTSSLVGRGVSQRRWKMIAIVLSLLAILRRCNSCHCLVPDPRYSFFKELANTGVKITFGNAGLRVIKDFMRFQNRLVLKSKL